MICGVLHRGEAVQADPARNAGALEAVLAALPGAGRSRRIDGGAATFGQRALWAEGAEEAAPTGRPSVRGLTVAADARLDNRAELADALGLAGPQKAAIGDRELILRAYERWGEDCPPRLQGDYAFAVWDPGERLLFCARDAVGARPLYYAIGPDGRFLFASDVAAMLAAPGVADDLDEAQFAAYLTARTGPAGGTFFRAVRSLPPGHGIAVGATAERIRRWWRPEDAPPVLRGSDEDYEREFLEHCRNAVRDRLRGGHPLGVHLSGGLDSSSVAVLAAHELRPHAFCWHPPPSGPQTAEEAAEYRLIESVCAQEGLRPHYHAVSTGHALDWLRRDVTRFPNRDGTLLHESLVQRTAADLGVRIILSGWGGDEVASYSGRGYHAELLGRGRLGQLLREARTLSDRPWRFVLRRALQELLTPSESLVIAALLRGEAPRSWASFAHPALVRRHRKRRAADRANGVRGRQLARLGRGHLAQRIEDWAASGARAAVEYRYPLLDRRLLEFALGLPAEQFRPGPGGRGRWLMRRALRPVLPRAVLEHTSKRDPARYAPSLAALRESLPAVAGQLAARAAPPARAEHLDMAKLRAHLDAGLDGKRSRPGKLVRALAFLDWAD